MKMLRRTNKMLNEPPTVLLTDLAFNLVIFFVVCASTDPDQGRKQVIPRSGKDEAAAAQAAKNVEVSLTRTTVAINSAPIAPADFPVKLKALLTGKTRTEDRMVVVKCTKDTPYRHWIRVTGLIEQAGGIVALQMEESRDVSVN